MFLNALDKFRNVHAVVAQPGNGIGLVGVSVPAMFVPITVSDFALVGRLCLVKEFFGQVDGIIQIIIIHVADIDMNLTL